MGLFSRWPIRASSFPEIVPWLAEAFQHDVRIYLEDARDLFFRTLGSLSSVGTSFSPVIKAVIMGHEFYWSVDLITEKNYIHRKDIKAYSVMFRNQLGLGQWGSLFAQGYKRALEEARQHNSATTFEASSIAEMTNLYLLGDTYEHCRDMSLKIELLAGQDVNVTAFSYNVRADTAAAFQDG